MKLTCTKHKLYDLLVSIRGAGGMPPAGKCHYKKAYRKRAWWMEWSTKRADFQVYFSIAEGRPVVITTVWFYNPDGSRRDPKSLTRVLDIKDLKERKMLCQ